MRWLDDKSRMSREVHVRIRERVGVRFPRATRLVITVSGHHSKRGWAERALQRLEERLAPLGVELNREKTQVVNTLGGEAFGFLGFDLRRVRKREGEGYYLLMTPKKKARKAIKAKIRDIIHGGGRDSCQDDSLAHQCRAGRMGQLFPGGQRQSCLQ
jgi:hypothetical protein